MMTNISTFRLNLVKIPACTGISYIISYETQPEFETAESGHTPLIVLIADLHFKGILTLKYQINEL